MALLIQLISLILVGFAIVESAKVSVDWLTPEVKTKTTPTLQVVTNPKYRRNSPVHKAIFDNLKKLNATHVRYAVWFPYPRLAVAALEPPTKNATSWNFTLIDPMFEDFMKATEGRDPMISFSTIPQWMFKTQTRIPYPDDPDQVDWNYSYHQGTEIVDKTLNTLAGYYQKIIQWYTKGGFTDELGAYRKSGHKYTIKQFEFLNEIEEEHKMTPQDYTQRYDAVVKAVKQVVPDMKFTGLALQYPDRAPTYVSYFLNKTNHQEGVPLDYISYHFYAVSKPNETLESMQYSFFDQADKFYNQVQAIEAIRKKLSPTTKTNVDETGTIIIDDGTNHRGVFKPIPDNYWKLAGANFAYVFTYLQRLGIEIAGMSQLVGFPSQFPSVSMLNWDTGAPNYRYWVLKMLLEECGPGDWLVKTTVSGANATDIMAVGSIGKGQMKRILLINKRLTNVTVEVEQSIKSVIAIDEKVGLVRKPANSKTFTFNLGPFDVLMLLAS